MMDNKTARIVRASSLARDPFRLAEAFVKLEEDVRNLQTLAAADNTLAEDFTKLKEKVDNHVDILRDYCPHKER